MKAVDLQRYLAGVLQIELDIYVQKKTVAELTRRYHALAKRDSLEVPQPRKPEISLMGCMITAGIISGIAGGIYGLVSLRPIDGFIEFIGMIIAALFVAVGALVGGGVLFGTASWLVLYSIEKKKLNEAYEIWVAKYESEIRRQDARIEREKKQKSALAQEIYALRDCLKISQKRLSEAYAFGILDPEYRNIFAVSSFYGYLAKGRTYSLHFNQQTGDQGAYNLYENECRLNKIITNTEAILDRIDQVTQYQHDLAMGLQEASQRIDSLCSSVNGQISRISDSVKKIERCQSIIVYNTECAQRNLAFLSWMHTFS